MRTLALAVLVLAAPAAAGPTVRVRSTGTCPSADAVAAALPPATAGPGQGGAALTIAVIPDDDGAAVDLIAGPRVEHTRVDGRDCAVLARAVAALADVWLVELDAPPPVRGPAAVGPAVVAPATVEPSVVAPRRWQPRWWLGAGRAFVVADSAQLGAATQLDVTWRSDWRDARVRVALDWGEAATLDGAGGTVSRAPRAIHATVGRRAATERVWLGAAAGAGLVISSIDASDGLGPITTVRFHPAGIAVVDAGVAIAAGVSVRLSVTGALFPERDRYTMSGVELAMSPRASLFAGLGLDVGLGSR